MHNIQHFFEYKQFKVAKTNNKTRILELVARMFITLNYSKAFEHYQIFAIGLGSESI